MMQKILDYLNKNSKEYNYCCNIFDNKIYRVELDIITKLLQVDDRYVLTTCERGKETKSLAFKDRDVALFTTVLLLEKNRYFSIRSKLLSSDIDNVASVMGHAKKYLKVASRELNVCTVNNFYVECLDNNYVVIFNAGYKKYIILNTYLDKLWAYKVALNYSLELENFYLINKELKRT